MKFTFSLNIYVRERYGLKGEEKYRERNTERKCTDEKIDEKYVNNIFIINMDIKEMSVSRKCDKHITERMGGP